MDDEEEREIMGVYEVVLMIMVIIIVRQSVIYPTKELYFIY